MHRKIVIYLWKVDFDSREAETLRLLSAVATAASVPPAFPHWIRRV